LTKDLGSAAAKMPDGDELPKRHRSLIEALPKIQAEPIAKLRTEVFVPLAGGPGTLARMLAVISAAGSNIAGFAQVSGTLHLLPKDSRGARDVLIKAGFLPSEAEVVVLGVVDRPGIAMEVFRRIAEADINVTFSYLATDNRMVIGVSDPVEAARILNG
jgi:hypothetical protein